MTQNATVLQEQQPAITGEEAQAPEEGLEGGAENLAGAFTSEGPASQAFLQDNSAQ